MRHEFSATTVPVNALNKLVKAVVIPRPIAWVSSRSADGVDNLAPHSFFTVVSTAPPMVSITSSGRKDTLNNVEATGEFVVNLATSALFETINGTGTNYPPELSEFDQENVEREPASVVAPPRVAASPAALECRLDRVIEIGDSFLIIGEVVHAALAGDVVEELGEGRLHPRADLLAPLSRLGRDEWGELGGIRHIRRRSYQPPSR